MGNAAGPGLNEQANTALCMTPTCRIFGAQMARKSSSCDPDCSTITVKLDTETSDCAVWPQSPGACLAPLEPLVKTLSQEPVVADRRAHELHQLPRLLAREDGPVPRAGAGIPRSLTRGLDGDGCGQMREAAAAAMVAEAERRMREEKLRRELDGRRAEEVKRRAEVLTNGTNTDGCCPLTLHSQWKARDEIARATLARHAKEEQEAREKVDQFLSTRGFRGARDSRRRLFRTSYPLHVAVGLNDAEMVKLLLQAGADPSQRDSSGRTPQVLARKCNRGGSHEKVLSMLAAL